MEKIKLGTNIFDYPMPVTLLGSVTPEGKANFMALGWLSRVNGNPPMVAIGVNRVHHTVKGIRAHGEFSINYPAAEMLRAADYCGIHSGAKTDKSGLFELFRGDLAHAPMIAACPLCYECRVFRTVDLPSHDLFIGEIVNVFCEERFLTDGKPDIKKMNLYTLTIPDNAYWSVGERIGSAWKDGVGFCEV
ncbi:MAG: flavin reductase family protein [Spirochaetes bacterium]|nr:flavin reductase family protein [Spirochaetota bacterium]